MDAVASPTSSTNLNPSTGSLTPSLATRPVTSKARGVCKFYTDPRGCYAKDNCKFLHSEPPKEGEDPVLTPYDSSKTCKFYAQGYCRRGDQCWFLHTDAKGKGALEEEDDLCSICFEKPTTYGLLTGCSHIFCTTCIKQWRDPSRKPIGVLDSGNTKRCPMCRAPSRFITPSSKFWADGSTEKQKTVESYRESMRRVQCRFFQKSIRKDRLICPFGNECFYQHKKPDGTIHVFRDGVEDSMRRYRIGHHNRGRFAVRLGEVPYIPGIDLANFTIAAALDLNPNLFDVGATNPMRDGRLTEGETMAVAFDMLANHLRESTGAAGSNQTRQDGEGVQPGEALTMMRLLDVVREQLLPGLRSTTGAATPPSNRPPPNATRNGTATVADEADEDLPPMLEPIDGYESDHSMPGLQSVSSSNDSEDDQEDNDDDAPSSSSDDPLDTLSRQVVDTAESAQFFRDFPSPAAEIQTPQSRPASSARFSTVVDRSNIATGSASPAAQSTSTGSQMDPQPQMSLLEWARAVIQMDEEEEHEEEDDDDDEMPPLEAVPGSDGPSSSRTDPPNDISQPRPNASQTVTDNTDDEPPPLHPAEQVFLGSIASAQPATASALPEATTITRQRSGEQEFTTDGRGRVISIGGPEHSSSQTPTNSDEEEGSDASSHVAQVPPAIHRQASEFTTDGRGRVISVGDSVASGSSTTMSEGEGTMVVTSMTGRGAEGPVGPGHGRGFFAWFPFNSLF